MHRKLAQQAEQAAQLISAQELREESEQLLKTGQHELAVAKLQSAFRLVERAGETAASSPIPEFQFRLKRDLEEALGAVVREEKKALRGIVWVKVPPKTPKSAAKSDWV